LDIQRPGNDKWINQAAVNSASDSVFDGMVILVFPLNPAHLLFTVAIEIEGMFLPILSSFSPTASQVY
jgi:hypothetical protein